MSTVIKPIWFSKCRKLCIVKRLEFITHNNLKFEPQSLVQHLMVLYNTMAWAYTVRMCAQKQGIGEVTWYYMGECYKKCLAHSTLRLELSFGCCPSRTLSVSPNFSQVMCLWSTVWEALLQSSKKIFFSYKLSTLWDLVTATENRLRQGRTPLINYKTHNPILSF